MEGKQVLNTLAWKKMGRGLLKTFTSLQLTVICLSVSMVLVFLSTLAQTKWGIYEAQARYFSTWFVWFPVGQTGISLPLLPGGYLVGGVLILNLLAAHTKRFRLGWNKVGLFLVHIGILIVLLGGFVTHWFAHEGQLRFDEGQTKHFYESFLGRELVVTENLPGDRVRETVFPASMLRKGTILNHPNLPFDLSIEEFFKNTRLTLRRGMGGGEAGPVDRGWGQRIRAESIRQTFKMNEQNLLTAYMNVMYNEESIGTWMVTNAVPDPQHFQVEERGFSFALRRTRYYMPFSLTLNDFTHDRYPGTNIPKNFSSLVEIGHPEYHTEREALIYMNNPLRYRGKTFFQQGFDNDDTTSILQVVQNPGWLLPYVSCTLVGLGLFWHFTLHLLRYFKKRRAA